MRCTNCNADNPANASFCSQCGRSLTQWTSADGNTPVAATAESALILAAMPWKPIASPEQAKALTNIGVASLAIAAGLALLNSAAIGFFGVLVAAVLGACAVGTHKGMRAAAGIGFALFALNAFYLLANGSAAMLLILLPLALGIWAGVRGTERKIIVSV
jgi:hypothetical protein